MENLYKRFIVKDETLKKDAEKIIADKGLTRDDLTVLLKAFVLNGCCTD